MWQLSHKHEKVSIFEGGGGAAKDGKFHFFNSSKDSLEYTLYSLLKSVVCFIAEMGYTYVPRVLLTYNEASGFLIRTPIVSSKHPPRSSKRLFLSEKVIGHLI